MMIDVKRFTEITLGDQIIRIMTDDEPKIIEALSKKKSFEAINPEEWVQVGAIQVRRCCDTCEVRRSGSGETCAKCDSTLNLWRNS